MHALMLISLMMAAASGRAGERATNENPRTITVAGRAEVKVVPDEVTILVGVEGTDKELAKAKREVDERIKRIIAVARTSGIDEKMIATDRIGIDPRTSSSGYVTRSWTIEAYTVRRGLQIVLRDVGRFDQILSAIVEAGANVVGGVTFSTTELRKHRDEARELAMKAAFEKATALAKTMGMKVGKPRSITEGQGGWWSGYGAFNRGSSMSQNVVESHSGPLEGEAVGLIGVTADVTVMFDME